MSVTSTVPDTDKMSDAEFSMAEALEDGDYEYATVPVRTTAASLVEAMDTVTPAWDLDYAEAVARAIRDGDPSDLQEVGIGLEADDVTLNAEEDSAALESLLTLLRERPAK